MKKKLIVGNWKMNGSLQANADLVSGLVQGLPVPLNCGVGVAVPAAYLAQVQTLVQVSAIAVAAQDVSQHEKGAYTGEVSASMLQDFGVRYALVGHSERRQYHGETDAVVAAKAQAALAKGITPIVCVGETLTEREAGQTEQVVKRQLAAVIHHVGQCISELVVAYEPVWAIGTGKTATAADANEVCGEVRKAIAEEIGADVADKTRIQYGGSVKPTNVDELLSMEHIDGALVGGASLEVDSYLKLLEAGANA